MTRLQKHLALKRARKAAMARNNQAGTSAAAKRQESSQDAAHKATMDFYMKAGRRR